MCQVLNGAAVINAKGQIAGCYFKRHPTPGEINNGVSPGSLDTQANPIVVSVSRAEGVLRIGLAICFDVNWPELWESLAGKDPDVSADVVVWVSAYPGGMPLQMRALEMQKTVVSCVQGIQPSKVPSTHVYIDSRRYRTDPALCSAVILTAVLSTALHSVMKW